MSTINTSPAWSNLASHAEEMKSMHLKDLLSDASRCSGLTAEHDGIYLDYSRENVTAQTMVSNDYDNDDTYIHTYIHAFIHLFISQHLLLLYPVIYFL